MDDGRVHARSYSCRAGSGRMCGGGGWLIYFAAAGKLIFRLSCSAAGFADCLMSGRLSVVQGRLCGEAGSRFARSAPGPLLTRHLKLTIAYDGTDFHCGHGALPPSAAEGEIVSVLRRLTQENIALHAAGCTDAGVHALGQVGSFRTEMGRQCALNAILPPTIRIVAAEEVGPDFSAEVVGTQQNLSLSFVF